MARRAARSGCGLRGLSVLLAALVGFKVGTLQLSAPCIPSAPAKEAERAPAPRNLSRGALRHSSSAAAGDAAAEPPRRWSVPSWSVAGAHKKRGAGLLFFAYGGSRTLQHFLREAAVAAQSFRNHNPTIEIAVVSNNASVGKVFTKHIKPRSDLLFAGENLQHRSDNIARQWLTRVYYLAHSPFRITWALDSNVVSCSPGQAQRMLDEALATNLWGYNIAHASQNLLSSIMYPHNFNIIYTWDMVASDLFREWFLTAVSEGVASDDQKSLHIAELRLRAQLTAAGRDLFVGRVAPEYSAAFYDVMNRGNKTHAPTRRADRIRITPVLNGAVHLLHGTNASLCATFNQNLGIRQLLVKPKGREQKGHARQLIYTIVTDGPACAKLLGDDARYCLLRGPSGTASSITLQDYILPSQLEDLHAYAHSRRCGEACEGVLLEETRDDSASRAGALSKAQAGEQRWPQEFHTPCADISGKRLQYFDRFEPRCPDGKVMQRFALTSIGCRSGTFRVSFVCVDVHATNRLLGAPLPDIFQMASECAPVRGEALHELQAHPFSCGPRYGLQGWRLSSEGCSRKRHMRFHYDCVHLGYEEVPREDTISDSSSCSDAIRAPDATYHRNMTHMMAAQLQQKAARLGILPIGCNTCSERTNTCTSVICAFCSWMGNVAITRQLQTVHTVCTDARDQYGASIWHKRGNIL